MNRRLLNAGVIAMCSACGRVGFDAHPDDDTAGADGAPPGGDGGQACGPATVTGCAEVAQVYVPGLRGRSSNDTTRYVDDGAGSCGGTGGGDYGLQLTIGAPGTMTVTVTAAFDSVLYLLQGDGCGGTEVECVDVPGTSGESIQRAVLPGQRYTAIADSNGGCGPVIIAWE